MSPDIDDNLTTLAKKKVGWVMEIMEMDKSSQDAKIRVKKAIWTLLDEIKESLNQEKLNQNDKSKREATR